MSPQAPIGEPIASVSPSDDATANQRPAARERERARAPEAPNGDAPPIATDSSSSPDPFINRHAGKYRLVSKIGEGGMGSVYLGRHDYLDTEVAVKTLLPNQHSAQLIARLRQEGLALARVEDCRAPRVIDVDAFADGTPYVVMELIRGRSLRAVNQGTGPLDVIAALKISARLADGLARCHAAGIVHRDIKPSNIILKDGAPGSWNPYLVDFGVARLTHAAPGKKLTDTADGALIGTSGYISPEAATGQGIDGRADVFSLGVVLYELLTGALPFPVNGNLREAVMALLGQDAPPLRALRPARLDAVPSETEAIVRRALEKDPARRYTMAELARALGAELSRLEGRAGQAPRTFMSVLHAPLPEPAEAPTLSASAEEVAKLVERVSGARVQESESLPLPSPLPFDHQDAPPAPRRNAWWWLTLAAIALVTAFAFATRWILGSDAPAIATVPAPPLAPTEPVVDMTPAPEHAPSPPPTAPSVIAPIAATPRATSSSTATRPPVRRAPHNAAVPRTAPAADSDHTMREGY